MGRGTAGLMAGLTLALLAGAASGAHPAADKQSETGNDFSRIDTNGNGEISMEELIAHGQDDLAFRAMDINGDGRVDPEEYAKRREAQGTDKTPKPALPGKGR